jgi:DNA helicase-2/ATP-dependent DNA helicase PcrA
MVTQMSSHIQTPTQEQTDAIKEENNLVITAKPGSGKTFTIIEKIKNISDLLLNYQGVIAISFTRKASHELLLRAKKKGISIKQSFFGTIDSFYISDIIIPHVKLLTQQLNSIEVHTTLMDYPEYKELIASKGGINKDIEELLLTSLRDGHVFLDICGETAYYILMHVKECMEYLKARYTNIFVDEYQDCGDIQNKIFMTLVENGIVGIAVGDLDQAIYAFDNRYSKYLASLISSPQFTHQELTKNHRCHKSISNYSLRLMGGKVNPVGELRIFKINVNGCERELMQAIDANLPIIKNKYGIQYNNEIAILCRSNSTASKCCEYIATPAKLFVDNELDRLSSYWSRLFCDFLQCFYDESFYKVDFVDRYLNEEYEKAAYQTALRLVDRLFDANEYDLRDMIDDIVELAKIIYPEYENSEVVNVLCDILSNPKKLDGFKPALQDEICVLTLHKSKGLEYKAVFLMDLYKWVFPFEGCSNEDYAQSLNLHYVGITRAIEACYIMQGVRRYRAKQKDFYHAEESPFLQLDGLPELRIDAAWNIT